LLLALLLLDVAGAVNASSSLSLAAGVGVVVVAVEAVAFDDDDAAVAVLLAFRAPTAMHPARVTIPTTLETPVILRARRAG
jgi:hypothetical protein